MLLLIIFATELSQERADLGKKMTQQISKQFYKFKLFVAIVLCVDVIAAVVFLFFSVTLSSMPSYLSPHPPSN